MKIRNMFPLGYEQAHDKTYNKACVTSKDSDQSVNIQYGNGSLVFSIDIPEAVEGTCDQRRL